VLVRSPGPIVAEAFTAETTVEVITVRIGGAANREQGRYRPQGTNACEGGAAAPTP
jgi:hypothetical protein